MTIIQELQETRLVDGANTNDVVTLRSKLKEDIAASQNSVLYSPLGPSRGKGLGEGGISQNFWQ
jgi:hypothetical protein